MKNNANTCTKLYSGPVAIIFSFIICGYWIIGNSFNVYTYKLTGAIFEILWIFMLPMLFVVPITSLIAAIMNKFRKSYLYFLSIIFNVGTFIGMNL
ncbi:MAG: hypothetical protein ACQERC_04365 [Bacteroidota bacterium]